MYRMCPKKSQAVHNKIGISIESIYTVYESLIRTHLDQLITIFTGFQPEGICSAKFVIIFSNFAHTCFNIGRAA